MNKLIFGDGILSAEGIFVPLNYNSVHSSVFIAGAEHRLQRKILNPHFASSSLKNLMPVLSSVADDVSLSADSY